MTDNFNFDDLPEWLKKSGAGGEEPAPDDEPSVEWENRKPTDASAGGRLGVTGELPWLQGSDPNEGSRRSSELEGLDWDTLPEDEQPAARSTGFTGDLPDWVTDDDSVPDLGEDFADVFASAVDEADDIEVPSDLGLKRIEPSGPKIRKLGAKDQPADPSEMTFDEWERHQDEKAYRKDNAEQIQVEQDIPDWFRDNVDLGDAERSLDAILFDDIEDVPAAVAKPVTDELSTSANYVPEWFLGLEEQNLEAAPDWVREATSNTDIRGLTDSSMFALPPELEEVSDIPAEEPQFEDSPTATDDWLGSIAQAQDNSLSELDDLMADAAVLVSKAPNTAALLSDVLREDSLQQEMNWLTTSSDDSFTTAIQPSGDDFEDWMNTSAEDIPDTNDFIAMVQTPESAETGPGWMTEQPNEPSIADDDDLFAALLSEGDEFSSDSVDWLGDVKDLDFDEAAALTERPATPRSPASREDVRQALKNTGSVDQILTDLLSTTAAPRSIAVDNQSRQLVRAGGNDNIDDLFEDVDDDFLAALNAADALPAISEQPLEAVRENLPPGWIEDLRPDRQVRLTAGGIELDFEQQPPNALPDNVQALRDASLAINAIAPNETTLDSGALAGVTGGLSVLSLDRPEGETVLQGGITVSPQQSRRIDLLNEVLEVGHDEDDDVATDDAAARPRRKARRRSRLKLDRTFVAVVLVGAVAGPFATDALHITNDPQLNEIAVQQASVFAAIDALEANDRVLLAFEYGPTAAGELNPLAEAVLRDIFNQGAVPVALSTNPLGGTNSYFVLSGLATNNDFLSALERDNALEEDRDYYSVGFVSGGPVAIRALSRSETTGVLTFNTTVDDGGVPLEIGRVDATDFALVLVIAETTEDLRNWAEQFQVEGLPMFALVTTAIEPIASAYLNENGGYKGYLAGYRDTYRYNQIRNTALRTPLNNTTTLPDPELAQWHSVALGALASGGVIMLGTLLNLIRGLGKRRR